MRKIKMFFSILLIVFMTSCFAVGGNAAEVSLGIESQADFSLEALANTVKIQHTVDEKGNETVSRTLCFDLSEPMASEALSAIHMMNADEVDSLEAFSRIFDAVIIDRMIEENSTENGARISPDRHVSKVFVWEDIISINGVPINTYTVSFTVEGTYSSVDRYATIESISVVESGQLQQLYSYEIDMSDCLNGSATVLLNGIKGLTPDQSNFVTGGIAVGNIRLSTNGNLMCDWVDLP